MNAAASMNAAAAAAAAAGSASSAAGPLPAAAAPQLTCSRAALSASLLSRMAAAKGALEQGAGRAWLCAKLNVHGARQLRAVGLTSRGVLNLRPLRPQGLRSLALGARAPLPLADASRGALLAAGRAAALSRVDAAAWDVSRLVPWEALRGVALEAAAGAGAAAAAEASLEVLCLRVDGMAHELRYESPLARDVFAALREAQVRAAELIKLEALYHELVGAVTPLAAAPVLAPAPPPPPPPPSPPPSPPPAGLLREFGGQPPVEEPTAAPVGTTGLLTLLTDSWRLLGRFTDAVVVAGAPLPPAVQPPPPPLRPALLHAVPTRSWTAAELLSAAAGPTERAGAASGAGAAAAAGSGGGSPDVGAVRSQSAARLDALQQQQLQMTQQAAATDAGTGSGGGGGGGSARLTLPGTSYDATVAEVASAARIAALVQGALYDPHTPEGRTRGKFLATDIFTAITETNAMQAAAAAAAAAAAQREAAAAVAARAMTHAHSLPPAVGAPPMPCPTDAVQAPAGSSTPDGWPTEPEGALPPTCVQIEPQPAESRGTDDDASVGSFDEAAGGMCFGSSADGDAAKVETDLTVFFVASELKELGSGGRLRRAAAAAAAAAAVMAPAPPAAAPPSAAVERVQVAQSMPTETSAPVAVVSRVVSSSSLLLSNLSGALTSLTSAIVSGYAGAAAAALPPAAPPSTPLPTASPLAPTTPVDGEEAGLAPAHDSSSPQSDGSLFKPLHDPGLPELPLFVALREVRALLTAFIMTRRRGVLRSASDSMRWGWSPPSGSEYGSDGGGGDDGGSDKEDELLASLSSSRSGGGTGSEGLPPGGVRLMRDISATFAANAARGILLAEAEAAAAATVSGSRVADAACPEAHAGSGSASLPPRLPRADVARSRSVLALTVAEPRSGASFAELLRCPAYIAQLIDAVGEEAVGSTLRTPLSVHFIVQREVEASLYNVVSVRRAVASAVRNAVDGASAAAIIERQRRLRGVTRLQAHFGVPAALQAADGWAQAGLELRAANGLLCPREKMEALLASVRAIYRTHARAHAAAALASAAAAATAAAAPVDAAAPLRTCGGVAGASTCPCPAHAAAMHSSAHGERVAALAAGIPPITGDDLLQIFLCVLVRAQLEDPLTLCATLWATLDSTDLLSHCGYYLTALEASCAFLAPPAN